MKLTKTLKRIAKLKALDITINIAIVDFFSCYLNNKLKLQVKQQFDFRSTITISKENAKIIKLAKIDIDAKSFANKHFLKRNKIRRRSLKKSIYLRLIDSNRVSNITYIINVYIKFDNYEENL